MLIRPTSLVLKELFFCILSVLTRLVRLIGTKTTEYFFGRHLCIGLFPIEPCGSISFGGSEKSYGKIRLLYSSLYLSLLLLFVPFFALLLLFFFFSVRICIPILLKATAPIHLTAIGRVSERCTDHFSCRVWRL